MLKKSILSLFTLISVSALALDKLPDGHYKGLGQYKDSTGKSGGYYVDVDIKDGKISNTYNFGGNKDIKFTMTAVLAADGTFPVVVGGATIGEGYCATAQCHYDIAFGKFTMEETMTFYEDHLYRLGSKFDNGVTIRWEESSELKKD